MFPEPTEVLLIGCLTGLIWTPKIQIKYIDTKNQLADMLTKGKFHTWRMESSCCVCSILAISVLQCALHTMAKRSSTRSRWRTSHSKIATNDESCCKGSFNSLMFGVRKPGKKSYGSQSPWSAKAGKDDRTEQPVVNRDPSHEVSAPSQTICWKLVLSTLLRVGRWQSSVFSREESWYIDGW